MDDDILERDELGAFTRHTHVAIEGSGKGPLEGLTFGAKDIYDIAGHKTGFGSPDWLRTHDAASKTAPVVQQLLDAGANMLGKTHTDELTFSLHGENHHYGTPQNANAPGRICGGSSSGSASAVAGGLVDFAVGSDTGGLTWDAAEALAPLGSKATVHSDLPRLVSDIAQAARPGDHILVMSNGGFGGIHQKLLDALEAQPGR